MTDHRRIQRTLFRMQHDALFAARLRARDAAIDLAPEDLELLLSTLPAEVEADFEGKRRAQLLRNVSSEFVLCTSRAGSLGRGLVDGFAASARFHKCIATDGRLPLAFGEHAAELAATSSDALVLALARIELEMARARRDERTRAAPRASEVVLAPSARVLEVPAGTMDAAASIRVAVDAGQPSPSKLIVSSSEGEHVLIVAAPARSAHRLREVSIEQLGELAGAFCVLAEAPVGSAGIEAFSARHDVEADELAGFVASLVDEGVLVRGGR